MNTKVTPPEFGLGTNTARWKGKERQAAEPDNPELFLSRNHQFCYICDDFVAPDSTRCVSSGHIPIFDDVPTEDEKPPTMSSWTTDAGTDDDVTFSSAGDTQASSLISAEVEMCDVPVEEHFFPATEQAPAQSPYELPVRSNEPKTCILTAEEAQVIAILRNSANLEAFLESLKLGLISSPVLESAEETPRPAVDFERVDGPSSRFSDAYRFGPDERARAKANLIKYVETRNSNPCKTHRKPRSTSPEPYQCLFNCGFSAKRGDYLFKHLLLTFPQQFWYCSFCEELPIYHQHDKFQDHLKAAHKSIATKDNICEGDMSHRDLSRNSELTYVAPFPTTCPFAKQDGFCQTRFRSWKEFKEHLLQHFREKIPGPWELRHWSRGPPRDDDDGQNQWGTSTSNYNLSHHATDSGPSEPGSSKQGNRVDPNQGWARYRSGRLETTETLDAVFVQNRTLSWILDVEAQHMTTLLRLVDVRTKLLTDVFERPPYLALIVVYLGKQPLGSSTHALEQLLRIYSTAIQITRDMGYQFLWIDGFCESPVTGYLREQRQREASLVLIMSGTETVSGKLWHCLCPHKNLETVFSSSFNLQFANRRKLSHSTYRAPDEVLHKPLDFHFAHKQLLHCKQPHLRAEQWPNEKQILHMANPPNMAKPTMVHIRQKLIEIFTSPVTKRVCVIRGLGGRGKSTLALHWHDEMRQLASSFYSSMLWIKGRPGMKYSTNPLLWNSALLSNFDKTRSFALHYSSLESQGGVLDIGGDTWFFPDDGLEPVGLVLKLTFCLDFMRPVSMRPSRHKALALCRKTFAPCHGAPSHSTEKHGTVEVIIDPNLSWQDRMLYSKWQIPFKQLAKQSFTAANSLRHLHILDSLDGHCDMNSQWLPRVMCYEYHFTTSHNLSFLETFDREHGSAWCIVLDPLDECGIDIDMARYPRLLIMGARRSFGRSLLQNRGSLPNDAVCRWMLMSTVRSGNGGKEGQGTSSSYKMSH